LVISHRVPIKKANGCQPQKKEVRVIPVSDPLSVGGSKDVSQQLGVAAKGALRVENRRERKGVFGGEIMGE